MVFMPVCHALRYMWERILRSGLAMKRFTDCDWSSHFCLLAAASITNSNGTPNTVRCFSLRASGMSAISSSSPSKYLRLSSISLSQRPSFLRSLTSSRLRTVKLPPRLDLTKRFL